MNICRWLFIALFVFIYQACNLAYALEVSINLKSDGISEPFIYGTTNLPSGSKLYVNVWRKEPPYGWRNVVTVKNGKFKLGPLHKKSTFKGTGAYQNWWPFSQGLFNVEIITQGDLSKSVQDNLSGPLVFEGYDFRGVNYKTYLTVGDKSEADIKGKIKRIIKTVKRKERTAIANMVSYPLMREVPLPSIKTPKEFLERFDEVFDEKCLNYIVSSNISNDWRDMGWRGIMLNNGRLMFDTINGKITSIYCQTEKEKQKRTDFIESGRRNLHTSLRQYVEPMIEWTTTDKRIRIDRTSDVDFRYASWPITKTTHDEPDLVLNGGEQFYDGSGGNHHYDFKRGDYIYRCFVNVMRDVDDPPGVLEVYQNDNIVFSQPVLKVITGL